MATRLQTRAAPSAIVRFFFSTRIKPRIDTFVVDRSLLAPCGLSEVAASRCLFLSARKFGCVWQGEDHLVKSSRGTVPASATDPSKKGKSMIVVH